MEGDLYMAFIVGALFGACMLCALATILWLAFRLGTVHEVPKQPSETRDRSDA
jgi:hypothetical protein